MTTPRTLTDADRRHIALAVHEAAHAVVGVLHGAQLDSATVADNHSDGACRFTAAGFGTTPTHYRAHIAAAGAVAAAIFHHGRQARLHHIERFLSPGDREELRLAAITDRAPFTEPLLAVKPTILRCWDAITDLSATLIADGQIRHRDVCTALGLTDDGGPGSAQLAGIRAGLR